MTVNGIVAAGTNNTYQTSTKKDIVGKDDFLLLLVTQLKNQDPLEPMKDREFMAQMAQFSSLEQLQNLGQQLSINQALTLIGTEVTALSGDAEIRGIVERVRISEGEPLLMIGEQGIKLTQLVQVALNSSEAGPSPADGESGNGQ
ncbi:flagellar hook capping FlgD N-terminal domain-containing protein [Zhaonella formicivorans]|uniref:flagellar hook capping FlgD N-terminal domain-containing protein n=1 Tax=Zhaonella formicivorans TaxID=2528593 RepID=UPI0010F3159C|nr:flagellar hook capping FlgD N-terminal domain-containing protein [Zhaonella formicivorans]